jgi:hypothetical protein
MKHADLKGTYLYPGHMAVVYIEVSGLKREANVFHQLQFSFTNENAGLIRTVQCCQTDFSAQEPVILANPLRGGPWCAIYNPSWETGHRRRIFTWDGKARIPGRYAIDFMKLNEEGQYADGNDDSITKWFGYNADVLAVSDGVIAATKDVFPESVTMSTHPKYPSDSATGNYISLKIGDHQYVFYEHLKPGSIRVKPGQYVRKGEVIGSLGYTGQTTGPHLHIHVAANNSPLGAEGIPFEFASFKSLGVYKDFDDFGKKPWTKQTMDKDQQRPVPFEVIQF